MDSSDGPASLPDDSGAGTASDMERPATGLVLGGGGARAAYQAGVLQYLGEAFPSDPPSILTGVSAGSINAAHLAGHPSSWREATERLLGCWADLRPERVFEPRSVWAIARALVRRSPRDPARSLFDVSPLRAFLQSRLPTDARGRLTGVRQNMDGRLHALALTTSNYSTLQTVTWTQGCSIEDWERPNRVGVRTTLTIDHVMASAALPLLFPAVQLGEAWHGDGGLRMLDPLAPAVHLGADRLLVISTRYARSRAEADTPQSQAYPSPLQIVGVLVNALLLDVLEHDAAVLRRINRLVRYVPPDERGRLRPLDLLVIRPSVDLGQIADNYTLDVGPMLGAAFRALQAREGGSPDWLSMLLFTPDYIDRLVEIGYNDARRQHDTIERFFQRGREAVGASAVSPEPET